MNFLSKIPATTPYLVGYGYLTAILIKKLWIKDTADVDLSGKVVVITGANTGIGLETAVRLCRMGARVIMGNRDKQRSADAEAYIRNKVPSAKIETIMLDLSSLQSVQDFASTFLSLKIPLNILINNAGIVMIPYHITEDGHELVFQVNHLGHFLLTNLLLDHMKQSTPVRIINVSSMAHSVAKARDWEKVDRPKEESYSKMMAYSNSKLANILFTKELQSRLSGESVDITVNAVHPGSVRTEIDRGLMGKWPGTRQLLRALLFPIFYPLVRSPEEGARTTIYCAVAEELDGVGGNYYSNCSLDKESDIAKDKDLGLKLWEFSKHACKL